ncbi:MAG: GGDEF domain-containing protein [Rhodoferax sp.]|uniref:GGDEF domain-containing protein n=1 Tax=Rhodoferax sp. TaxID=50421 RepID=UPI003263D779
MSEGPPRTSPRSLLWVVVLATSLGLMLPAIVLGGVVMGWVEPRLTANEQQAELQSKLELLSQSVSEVLWNLEVSGVAHVVSAVMESPNVVGVQVVDLATATDFYRDAKPERAIGHQYRGERDVLRNGVKIGQVRMVIDDHLAADSQIRHRLLYLSTALAQLLVAVLLVVVLLHRLVIQPLRSLGGFANAIASGNFSNPVASAKIQEINQLTYHMLHMQRALQEQFAANDLHKQQLLQTAHYDALTGLPNRVLLADRLPKALAQSVRRTLPLALLFLDLDGFKWVNDTHGHEVGDRLLKGVSQHLQAMLRDGDMLARFGGDEFVAILMDLHHPHDAVPILERLLSAAAEPISVGEHVLRVSVSIGVALFDPQDTPDPESLYRKADQAMYYAKQSGKNRFHCASPLN